MAIEQPRLIDEPTLSVADLCAGIGRALRRAYPDAVWVRGEIANKRLLPQGHVFFDLVDPEDGVGVRVVLWRADRAVVNSILRRTGQAVRIDDGTEVRIRAEVGWHPRNGSVQLRMLAIDTAYTLGRLAEARELLVQTLDREGLLARQGRLELASVPLRVGLVTSGASAAAADFLETLGASGQAWLVTVVDTRVQGVDAEASVVRSIAAASGAGVDVVCLVRGGGSRTDLATFDREPVARAIASCPVPVLTGIGHETDTAVADLVAHRSFKTPTACAAFLVDRVTGYLDASTRAWHGIQTRALAALGRSGDRLERASARSHGAARHQLRAAELGLDAAASRLGALDPARLLARGWTMTRRPDGRLVRRSTELAAGDDIVTVFADGEVASRVQS